MFDKPDGFDGWGLMLAEMMDRCWSQGKMSWETDFSYNTVKKCLRRLKDGQGTVA